MTLLNYSDANSKLQHPTSWNEDKRNTLVQACKELAHYHYKKNDVIKYIYQKHSFHPNDLKSEKDLAKLPWVNVSAMKQHLLKSRNFKHAVLKLTSSGTKGQKTQIWFDRESLNRVQKMLDMVLGGEGLISDEKTNFLFFNYDPEQAQDLGTAFTAQNHTRFATACKINFALKKDNQGIWQFDKERVFTILQDYERAGLPIRIKGMPLFIYDFIQHLKERNKKFCFNPKSIIFTGGGWKAAEDKKIKRSDFRSLMANYFGVPKQNIRDGYGLAEHSAPYFECRLHKLHIPAFNHLIIRDPVTMLPLPDGEVGLLELISPYNTMMPNLAILSTDWACIDSNACPCGANSPTFTLMGRAGLSKHAGCALSAENIVKRN